MSESSLVMKGLLSEFNLAEVLQVVAMSRQFTAIELKRHDGRRNGIIWIKSGRVIDAQRGTVQGRQAFYELFGAMADLFVVWRLQDPPEFGASLGDLPELLMQADQRIRAAEGSRSGPRPRPVSAPHQAEAPMRVKPARAASVPPGTSPAALALVGSRAAPLPSAGPARSGIVAAICSPKGGVGKTTIALNLSVSLAQRGMKVILVDADINGDQLSLLDARDRVKLGAYDILDHPDRLDQALRDTAAPNLRLLPASGPEVVPAMLERASQGEQWRTVIGAVGQRCDIALVDCPAGMFGVTQDILSASTHAIGVLQSEMVAQRSFAMFAQGLSALPAERRPQLLGVVVNMFQRRSGPSVEAFHGICDDADRYRLFETTIPRSDAFAAASLAGQPLRLADGESLGPVAWLFDMLADEVCARFDLTAAGRPAARSFLI
jgi:chromosome partitioning protein